MAVVIPYGDVNAHGSIGGSITFRRSFGKVILEKKPYPRQPNSAGQIAQRLAFKNAVDAWYQINSITRAYYNLRGPVYNMSGYSLFIKMYLLNNLPSTTALILRDVLVLNITNLIAPNPTDILWQFIKLASGPFAYIYDNQNTRIYIGTADPGRALHLHLTNVSSPFINVPLWYSIYWEGTDNAYQAVSGLIRMPELTTSPGYFAYVAEDSSLYSDQALTELICTPLF